MPGKTLRTGTAIVVAGAFALAAGGAHAAFFTATASSGNTIAAASEFPRCYKNDVIADSPVGYWRLDDSSGTTASDAAGSNPGTYVGSPSLAQSGALADSATKAVALNGVDQYVDVADSASLDTGDIVTVELWAKRTATGTVQVLLDKGASSYQLRFSAAGTVELSRAGTLIVASTVAITDTTLFHHVVATKSVATVKLYIDGVDRTGTVANLTLSNSPDPLRIGTASPTAGSYASAVIDEVAVYATALGSTRVQAHFLAGRCYVDEPAADNPVGRWRLGEPAGTTIAMDSAGTNNATYQGGYTLGQPGAITNEANPAPSFDGSTGYAEVAHAAILNPNVWTIEAWVYPTGGAGSYRSALMSQDTNMSGYMFYGTPGDVWSLWCGSGTAWTSVDAAAIRLNTWAHLVGTYDGTTLRFYVNGVPGGSATATCSPAAGGRPLRIAAGNTQGDSALDYFPGKVDDVAIYATALSAERVAVHYFAGRAYRDLVVDPAPGLVSYWRLGETTGTTAVDEQNANPATYTNSPSLGQSGALAGDSNTAPVFNGSNQYLTAADSASLDTGDVVSVEAWIKRGSTGTAQVIVDRRTNQYKLYLTSGNKMTLRQTGVADIVTSTTTITDTTRWHHVAFTKSGSAVKLYIDGADVTGAVANRTLTNNDLLLFIGQSGVNSEYFNGLLDEMAIYNVALDAATVKLHYDAGRKASR